jgi:hypothetical protein
LQAATGGRFRCHPRSASSRVSNTWTTSPAALMKHALGERNQSLRCGSTQQGPAPLWKLSSPGESAGWRTSRQSAGGHSGQVSPIESSTSRTAGHGLARRDAERRIPGRDDEGALAGMRIGAVLHAAVLVALTDRASLLQHRDRPAPQRPDRGPPFLRHQHRENLLPGTNPCGPSAVPAADTGQGFRVAVPRVAAPCAQWRLSGISRIFDLNGEVKAAITKHRSPIIPPA